MPVSADINRALKYFGKDNGKLQGWKPHDIAKQILVSQSMANKGAQKVNLPEEAKSQEGWEKYVKAFPKIHSTLTTAKTKIDALKDLLAGLSKDFDSLRGKANVLLYSADREVLGKESSKKLLNEQRKLAEKLAKESAIFNFNPEELRALETYD